MYSQDGFTKIIIRDYMTKQVLYVFNNLLNSKLTAIPTPTGVNGHEFQLVPFNNTGNGMLVIQQKEISLDILSYLFNSELKEETMEVTYDEILTTDATGKATLTTTENIAGNRVTVYQVNNDQIVQGQTLILDGTKSFTSTFINEEVYATYGAIKIVKSIKWSPKTSKRYFTIEIENSIESSLVGAENKTMLTIIEKAYIENIVDIVDRLFSGSLTNFPLNFVILEDRDAMSSIRTMVF